MLFDSKAYLKSKGTVRKGIIKGENYFEKEEFYQAHIDCLPQIDAFLMKNTDEFIVTPHQLPNKRIRRLFGIKNNNWSDFEKLQLSNFYKYISDYKGKHEVAIPENYPEEIILRFLQASGFSNSKTIEYLHNHIEWSKIYFPFELTSSIIEILKSGFLYSYGRDHRFRPVTILNPAIYLKYRKKYSYADWLKAIIYFLEYKIHHLLIKGQVEDWIVISDMRSISLFSFPSELKDFIKVMQSNYRARLKTNYLIGMSVILRGLWGIIRTMLDPETDKKIKILGFNDFNVIWEMINKNQVEKRFEGDQKDLTSDFFPPRIPLDSNGNRANPKGNQTILYSKEEYISLVKEDKIFTICPYLVDEINFELDKKKEELNKIEMENTKTINIIEPSQVEEAPLKVELLNISTFNKELLNYPRINQEPNKLHFLNILKTKSHSYQIETNFTY